MMVFMDSGRWCVLITIYLVAAHCFWTCLLAFSCDCHQLVGQDQSHATLVQFYVVAGNGPGHGFLIVICFSSVILFCSCNCNWMNHVWCNELRPMLFCYPMMSTFIHIIQAVNLSGIWDPRFVISKSDIFNSALVNSLKNEIHDWWLVLFFL
jgi:hypothetical protein